MIVKKYKINSCNTIGSYAMNIVRSLNKNNPKYIEMLKFFEYEVKLKRCNETNKIISVKEKYN